MSFIMDHLSVVLNKFNDKNWKNRIECYDEVLNAIGKYHIDDISSCNNFVSILPKIVVDTNVACQEKALELVEKFCRNTKIPNSVCTELCSGLIQKCLIATKQKSKDRAAEILKLLTEAESQDIVFEELIKGLTQKLPKGVASCILVITEIIREMGPEVVTLKPLLANIPRLLEDRDQTVRDSAKQLILELYGWIGLSAPLQTVLSNLKPLVVSELTTQFETVQIRPTPIRFLRSQRPLKTVTKIITATTSEIKNVTFEPETVEVLTKLPNGFYNRITDTKWSNRKEALDGLEKLTNNPKLASGDYSVLVQSLLKLVAADSNVNVIMKAAVTLAQLATGLGSGYGQFAIKTMKVCFEQFKISKTVVVSCLRECADAAFRVTTLEPPVQTVLVESSRHKNPAVRVELCGLLHRYLGNMSPGSQSPLAVILRTMLPMTADSAAPVREAAYACLGLVVHLWPASLSSWRDQLDNRRLARVLSTAEDQALLLAAKVEKKQVVLSKKLERNEENDNFFAGMEIFEKQTHQKLSGSRTALKTITNIVEETKNNDIQSSESCHQRYTHEMEVDLQQGSRNNEPDNRSIQTSSNMEEKLVGISLDSEQDPISSNNAFHNSSLKDQYDLDKLDDYVSEFEKMQKKVYTEHQQIREDFHMIQDILRHEQVTRKWQTYLEDHSELCQFRFVGVNHLSVSLHCLDRIHDSGIMGDFNFLIRCDRHILAILCDQLLTFLDYFSTAPLNTTKLLLQILLYTLKLVVEASVNRPVSEMRRPRECVALVLCQVANCDRLSRVLDSDFPRYKANMHALLVLIYSHVERQLSPTDEQLNLSITRLNDSQMETPSHSDILFSFITQIKMPHLVQNRPITSKQIRRLVLDLFEECMQD